jgi:hypothetical protein
MSCTLCALLHTFRSTDRATCSARRTVSIVVCHGKLAADPCGPILRRAEPGPISVTSCA